MSTWGDIGLPAIDPQGYRYDVAAGLLRTPFPTSNPRQRRQNESNKRTFELQTVLDSSQLPIALGYLNEFGYTWFALPLLTGSLDEPIISLCVRLIKEYQVSVLGKGVYRLGFTVEQLVERSVIATTALYPIEIIESIGIDSPTSWTGRNYNLVQSTYIAIGAPASWSGSLQQTVFHHYYSSNESIAILAPNGWTGTLQQTVFHTYIPQHEDIAIGAPGSWTGTLSQTIFPVPADYGHEDIGVSAPGNWTGSLIGP